MQPSSITIIIPTTCKAARWQKLNRAIDSIFATGMANLELLLVVNGTVFDAENLRDLRSRRDLRVHYFETGSLPLALRTGRSLVNTEYFGFLDDDDEYLPNALSIRLQAFHDDPALDFVVSNGFRNIDGTDIPLVKHPELVSEDPLRAMLTANWLASCGGLYKSSRVGVEFFDPEVSHLEWTHLAYRLLSSGRKMRFVDTPTYRVNDMSDSLSKSEAYRSGILFALAKIRGLPLPDDCLQEIDKRIATAHHYLSEKYLQQNAIGKAWHHHRASLTGRSRWRYLAYTRHFLFKSIS